MTPSIPPDDDFRAALDRLEVDYGLRDAFVLCATGAVDFDCRARNREPPLAPGERHWGEGAGIHGAAATPPPALEGLRPKEVRLYYRTCARLMLERARILRDRLYAFGPDAPDHVVDRATTPALAGAPPATDGPSPRMIRAIVDHVLAALMTVSTPGPTVDQAIERLLTELGDKLTAAVMYRAADELMDRADKILSADAPATASHVAGG